MHEELDGKRVALWLMGGLVAVLALATVVLGYATGTITTLGYASVEENYAGVLRGRHAWLSTLGPTTFYAPEGWQFYVDYEVQAKAGSLRMWLHEPWVPIDRKVSEFRHISGTRSGRIVFDIPRSSLYSFDYAGSVLHGPADKTGYDIAYTITWGIQRR